MTKSKKTTLPPSAADDLLPAAEPDATEALKATKRVEPIIYAGIDALPPQQEAAPDAKFVGVFDPTVEPFTPSPSTLASDALEHATNLLDQAQHVDFSGPRHRAMQLIAEARALLG